MNIYFACSITGSREFESVYQSITRALLADGHDIPTAHLADPEVKTLEGIINPAEVYDRDTVWIRACDALVAEVSTPSHGVGFEVGYALSLDKPVLCVYSKGQKVSKMLTGNPHKRLQVKVYQDPEEAIRIIRSFLRNVTRL
jgi:2'-deoxynucleoside 5'-phosphate N-hydrolase